LLGGGVRLLGPKGDIHQEKDRHQCRSAPKSKARKAERKEVSLIGSVHFGSSFVFKKLVRHISPLTKSLPMLEVCSGGYENLGGVAPVNLTKA
jgi:hypothetical protein